MVLDVVCVYVVVHVLLSCPYNFYLHLGVGLVLTLLEFNKFRDLLTYVIPLSITYDGRDLLYHL